MSCVNFSEIWYIRIQSICELRYIYFFKIKYYIYIFNLKYFF